MKIAIIVPDNRDELRRYSDPDPYFGPAPTALLEGLAKEKTCEIHVLCCLQKPLRSPAKLAENVYYHSVVIRKWGWLRGAYAGCILAMRRQIQKINPEVVHGQGTERYCALASVFSGRPNVLTIHGNMRQIAKVNHARPLSFLWLTARLERLALTRTDGVVCISSHTEKNVIGLAHRTWMIPNAVSSSFFDVARQETSLRQILCVATISRLKNQNRLIEALEPLAKEESFKLVFLGALSNGDPYATSFLRAVSGKPWCEYVGFANQAALQSALAGASLLVLPSLEENCPMAVLEAMAAGVAIAATNAGGTPDLIRDGVQGLLFDPNNADAMRSAVATLLRDKKLRESCARRARETASANHHPDQVAARHIAVYREIIDRARKGSARRAR